MKKVLTILVLGLVVLSFSSCDNKLPKKLLELNKVDYDSDYYYQNPDIVKEYLHLCEDYVNEIAKVSKSHKNLFHNCGAIQSAHFLLGSPYRRYK